MCPLWQKNHPDRKQHNFRIIQLRPELGNKRQSTSRQVGDRFCRKLKFQASRFPPTHRKADFPSSVAALQASSRTPFDGNDQS